jgi:hypothetical protein
LTDGALSFATCSPSCGTCHRVIGARRRRPARSFVLHRSVACGAVGSGPWRGCSRAGRTSCCDAPTLFARARSAARRRLRAATLRALWLGCDVLRHCTHCVLRVCACIQLALAGERDGDDRRRVCTTTGDRRRQRAVRRKHSCAHGVTGRRMQQPAHSGQRALYRSPRANKQAEDRQLATSAISGEKCGSRQALGIQPTPHATYNHARCSRTAGSIAAAAMRHSASPVAERRRAP